MSSQQSSPYASVESQIQAIRSHHLLLEVELRTFLDEHCMSPARPEQWTKQLVSSLLSLNTNYLVQISQKVKHQARKYNLKTSVPVAEFDTKLASILQFIEQRSAELPEVEQRIECARGRWNSYQQRLVQELLDTTRQCQSPYKTSDSIWASVAPVVDTLRSLSSRRDEILRRALIIDQDAALHWDGQLVPPPNDVHRSLETLKGLLLEIKGQYHSQNVAMAKLHAETAAAGSRPETVSDLCGGTVNLMDLADAATQYASFTRFLDLLEEMKAQIDDAMKKLALKLASVNAGNIQDVCCELLGRQLAVSPNFESYVGLSNGIELSIAELLVLAGALRVTTDS
ncbi:hypothetical protein FKP32DRAFT_1604130 [Trametes sanguinea]|nr:hypothetical protein FKP32DRAFT_1604130 [Trametes sanguinea]